MTHRLPTSSGLEKAVWTDADFEVMGWHDCRIYAVSVVRYDDDTLPPTRLLLDIDYIVRWVEPVPPSRYFSFWVAPATLVFETVWDLQGDLEGDELEIDHVHLLPPPDTRPEPFWHIEGQQFDLRLRAPGYTQYIRQEPQHVPRQKLTMVERGGISLVETAFTGQSKS